MQELTEFQKNIVNVLVGDSMYGMAIKRELEEYYGEEVNHGRLYPNLDKLEDRGYVRKYTSDERTNEYELTDEGRERLLDELGWRLEMYVNGSTKREKEVRKLLGEPTEKTAEQPRQ